jgi:hypothetical protein
VGYSYDALRFLCERDMPEARHMRDHAAESLVAFVRGGYWYELETGEGS